MTDYWEQWMLKSLKMADATTESQQDFRSVSFTPKNLSLLSKKSLLCPFVWWKERGKHAAKGQEVELNPWPLWQGQSLYRWGVCSTR